MREQRYRGELAAWHWLGQCFGKKPRRLVDLSPPAVFFLKRSDSQESCVIPSFLVLWRGVESRVAAGRRESRLFQINRGHRQFNVQR